MRTRLLGMRIEVLRALTISLIGVPMVSAWSPAIGSWIGSKLLMRAKRPNHVGAGTRACSTQVSKGVLLEGMLFGPHKIDGSQIFFLSKSGLTAAFVNLRPIVPGHVLVAPVKNYLKLHHMSDMEVTDLWLSAKEIGSKLEAHYKGEALNYAIQDGPSAGQSVPHVHIHILPRHKDDFEDNDDVYEELEHHKAFHVPAEGERRNRSKEEMAQEAFELRALFMPQKA